MSRAAPEGNAEACRRLQQFLNEQLARHSVVGASVAILDRDTTLQAASGVLNIETDVSVRDDSVFQIGSIGKVFTATLIAQLVDEEVLDLDAPVLSYLPDFHIADKDVRKRVTVRHLLTHTSGMDGDFYPPDDAWCASVESYVHKLALLPQLHPLGAAISYCNSGYVVAGRIVEVMRRMPWHRAVMKYICEPLGMQNAFADPREALRHLCAMGHVADAHDRARKRHSPITHLPLNIAPAGSVLSMSARDLLLFASMHMRGGESEKGGRILSAHMVDQMQKAQMPLYPHSRIGFTAMGLSWFLADDEFGKVIGHDGATAGQWAYMQCIPNAKQAFVLLTNSPSTPLSEAVRDYFFSEIAQRPVPVDQGENPGRAELSDYVGTYENVATRVHIGLKDSGLSISITSRRDESAVRRHAELSAISADCFQIESEDPALRGRIGFIGAEAGAARYVRLGVRLARRVGQDNV
jgi:CubicO group peptidase (beta-lactamase class C family)